MASKHIDKLTRDFISRSSNPYMRHESEGDKIFWDMQDPTFMSFKLDFFPDYGYSFPDDTYSSGGLFRMSGVNGNSLFDYNYGDSAAEYLRRIGAPNRQLLLEKFTSSLLKLQNEAPWFFQSVSGVADLFTIDPANNFRGKDKVLTIECLESIDMRMSMLADMYRNIAFDFYNMREVLPINLRTFSMQVHVLEFRTFNTTFGVIADTLSKNVNRTIQGEDKQKKLIEEASRRNVFGGPFTSAATSLFTSASNTLQGAFTNVNNLTGGLFSNLGQQPGIAGVNDLVSTFEPITVQTFLLKDCEFDFYSEAPGYYDSVSVKDATEATFKFKIKVGKIRKTGSYPFYNYVIAERMKDTRQPTIPLDNGGQLSATYFEETDPKSPQNAGSTDEFDHYRQLRESIYPSEGGINAQTKAYQDLARSSDELRRKPLENILARVVKNVTPYANQAVGDLLGNVTGGVIGNAPLGNVFDGNNGFLQAVTSLNSFLTPGNQFTVPAAQAPTTNPLGSVNLQGASPDGFNSGNVFNGTPPVPVSPPVNEKNVFNNEPPLPVQRDLEDKNILKDNTLPVSELTKNNILKDNPPLPNSKLGDENVFN